MKYHENTAHAIQLDTKTCNDTVPVTNITASSSQSGHPPSYAIDNNSLTRWANDGKGSWIQLDLGSVQNVCGIESSWFSGNIRVYNFVLAISADGTTFTNTIENKSKTTTSGTEKYNISTTDARFIRITVNGNSKNNYASISDIKVLGTLKQPNMHADNEDKKSVSVQGRTTSGMIPSISVRTGSWAYFPGDLIKISGLVLNSSGAPVMNNRVNIQVSHVNNSSNTIYKTTALTSRNGTFEDAGLRIEEPEYSSMWTSLGNLSSFKLDPGIVSKTYVVNVSTAVKGYSDSSLTYIQIRNAFLTPTNIALYLGGLLLLLFMLTIWWPLKSDIPDERQRVRELFKMGRQFKAVAIFVLISGIVLTPIVSFLLVDIETGKNSPLGLVKKETIVNGSRNIQWSINIGGNSGNNFSSGIQIPIYILIFGIIGGYIRYLYDKYNVTTKKIMPPAITDPKDGSTSRINNPAIRGTADPLTTVIIFDGEVPIHTTKADDRGLWLANIPSLPDGAHLIRAKATNDTTNSSEFSPTVNLTIEQAGAVVIAQIARNEIRENAEKENMKLFKESIQDLALIILSPLLALALWLVLFQGGTSSDFTLAAIAITTGFLIPEIVTRLINFATPRVTTQAA